ncbi:protease inhibitor I42 family protein [Nocardia sp. NPDC051570]|uniref:protease inhibitor I42 family protein n=1 Tax=Nocardia sp. NPDC051570 TaxID=3364324 RepID=UPI0037B8DFE0
MRIPLLIVALGLAFAACGVGSSGHADPPSASAPGIQAAAAVAIGAEADGKDVSLTVGQQLVLSLQANHTTGYQWKMQALDQSIVEQVGDPEYHPASTSNSPMGAGGTSVWHFTAVAPGTTTLALDYARSWEQDTAAAQHFTVTVQVRG